MLLRGLTCRVLTFYLIVPGTALRDMSGICGVHEAKWTTTFLRSLCLKTVRPWITLKMYFGPGPDLQIEPLLTGSRTLLANGGAQLSLFVLVTVISALIWS